MRQFPWCHFTSTDATKKLFLSLKSSRHAIHHFSPYLSTFLNKMVSMHFYWPNSVIYNWKTLIIIHKPRKIPMIFPFTWYQVETISNSFSMVWASKWDILIKNWLKIDGETAKTKKSKIQESTSSLGNKDCLPPFGIVCATSSDAEFRADSKKHGHYVASSRLLGQIAGFRQKIQFS